MSLSGFPVLVGNAISNQVSKGTNDPSIVGDLLQDRNMMAGLSQEERDSRLKELGHALYSGGADTTASLLLSFVAAMVLSLNVQAQAQKEIDLTLGPGVLPTIADRKQLPYIDRLILELMRWRPPLPIAIPHRCLEDDVYREYNIAKGTIVIGNLWAIGRDETIYKEPEGFDPDRFLDSNVPPFPVFGWGLISAANRKCPGLHFGQASLFITIASLLVMFSFSKKRDSSGNDIDPVIEDAPNSIVM
ncbi:Cytochrome P450 [Rhizoctonia solani]|uniref:Cytochrome P450 n=1 Tax=Rhizoctonia solani TaxID=456999 RepID=A0A0K6FMB2_9AGAM|nr:Cytochrome P450 [Rhizoctonia solani]